MYATTTAGEAGVEYADWRASPYGDVTWINSSKARRYIEQRIGERMRQLFADSQSAALPPVELSLDKDNRDRPSSFSFADGKVRVTVNSRVPTALSYAQAKADTTHEHQHWLWNVGPEDLGIGDEHVWTVVNIFMDTANEQRGAIESAWVRGIWKAGYQHLLDPWLAKVKKGEPPVPPHVEPLYRAAYLALYGHFLMTYRGWKTLKALRADTTLAREVWVRALEPVLGRPGEDIAGVWPEAWQLYVDATATTNSFVLVENAVRFAALFPKPKDPEPVGVCIIRDAHLGQSREVDAPAGGMAYFRPGGPDDPDAPETPPAPVTPASGGKPEAGDSPPPGGGKQPTEPAEGQPAASPPEPRVSGLEQDDEAEGEADAETQDDRREAREVEEHLREIQRPAEFKARRRVLPDDVIHPRDPRALVRECERDGAALAQSLRVSQRPTLRTRSEAGRLNVPLVARVPDADLPFRGRKVRTRQAAPGAWVGFLLDTSGSICMELEPVERRAAMVAHLGCRQARIGYGVYTSRQLAHLAGDDMDGDRSEALIAGFRAAMGADEGYDITMPRLFQQASARKEEVKIVVVITDGVPEQFEASQRAIRDGRAMGYIVILVGLGLCGEEQESIRALAGGTDVICCQPGEFARELGRAATAAVARGTRRVRAQLAT